MFKILGLHGASLIDDQLHSKTCKSISKCHLVHEVTYNQEMDSYVLMCVCVSLFVSVSVYMYTSVCMCLAEWCRQSSGAPQEAMALPPPLVPAWTGPPSKLRTKPLYTRLLRSHIPFLPAYHVLTSLHTHATLRIGIWPLQRRDHWQE